jgi:hypothetical protein
MSQLLDENIKDRLLVDILKNRINQVSFEGVRVKQSMIVYLNIIHPILCVIYDDMPGML